MKLEITKKDQKHHGDIVPCVGWANNTTLYSVSDDHKIMKWSTNSEDVQKVLELPKDTFITDLHWYPVKSTSRKGTASVSELCALATTNGHFALMAGSGKVERTTEGHTGAILKMRWSHDGTALATAGEDGGVKVWSKTGMLRSTLAQLSAPVYSLSWSPDSDHLVHTNGRNLVIKPLQPSIKPNQWKAHDGVILTVDWSQRNNTIVSGGEDKRYKVWDCFGRNLYTSHVHDSPITSLAWSPDGSLFAVGAHNMIRLCDKTGWSYSMEKSSVGTVMNLSWTGDGTQVAAACGGGYVVFASVVGRKLEWRNFEVTINGDCTADVFNLSNESREHLEFNDPIVKASLSWGHLLVITATQMYIYNCNSWSTPVTVDLKNTSVFIIEQTERFFLLVDSMTGVQVYSYEGRQVSVIKHSSVVPEAINLQNVSISNDTVAIRDRKDERVVHFFNTSNGKEIGDGHVFKHQSEVVEVALSQKGPPEDRQLAYMDKNYDLYLLPVRNARTGWNIVHIGSMVTTMSWNDEANILAAMQDGRFTVWYHPSVVYTDPDLLHKTILRKEGSEFSKSPHIVHFTGSHCTLRRSDGAVISTSTSPFPAVLHNQENSGVRGSLENAVRLCRFVKDPALWAMLAGMAAESKDLNTAEVAYAAIDEVHKVQHLQFVKGLPSMERRNAEMALFCKQPRQAETIYLQANMIYRAIQLNIQLYNWERALELAVKHKTHVDTVLAFRQKYLREISSEESLKKFKQFAEKITVDWEKIRAKVEAEEERESQGQV